MKDFLYYIYKHNNCDDMQYWDFEYREWTSDYSKVDHVELYTAQSIANILVLGESPNYFICIGKILPDKEPDPYFLGILIDKYSRV